MRKIKLPEILCFALMGSLLILLSISLVGFIAASFRPWLESELLEFGLAVLIFYLLLILELRIFLACGGLREGEIPKASWREALYHYYLLHSLIFIYPLTRSTSLPIPVYRLIYQMLGAKLGPETFPNGIITDPIFFEAGANTLLGMGSLVVCHELEGDHLSHKRVKLGDHVTIGAHAILMPGVTVGDRSIVGMHSLVTKDTNIGPGEVWGGVPARRLK